MRVFFLSACLLLLFTMPGAAEPAQSSPWKLDAIGLYQDLLTLHRSGGLKDSGLGGISTPGGIWKKKFENHGRQRPRGVSPYFQTPENELVAYRDLIMLALELVKADNRPEHYDREYAAQIMDQWNGAATCMATPSKCPQRVSNR